MEGKHILGAFFLFVATGVVLMVALPAIKNQGAVGTSAKKKSDATGRVCWEHTGKGSHQVPCADKGERKK